MPLFGSDKNASMQKKLFNCKFTAKSFVRESKKCEKSVKENKKKCKKAMEKGNIEGAKIYAENAIRIQEKSMNYLKLSSRIEAVAYNINNAIQQQHLTNKMIEMINKLDVVLKTMDPDKISAVLDTFETQFEDMDLTSCYMESAIDSTMSSTMPETLVENLMAQIADENGLEFQSDISSISSSKQYVGSANTIGLSVGGSRDVNNFRACIENNIMPSIGSITFNGLFYEYYFDTRSKKDVIDKNEEKDDGSMLFYPSYCFAKTRNVLSNEYEYYMSLGLNSNIKQDEFKRKHLNLVIVLDQSGSMGSGFSVDGVTNKSKSKMQVANESVVELLKHLTVKDRFGLITFESKSRMIQKLQFINDIDMNDLKNKILNIHETGGTNFESGYNAAIASYHGLFEDDSYSLNTAMNNEYENRIILLTDARPNVGTTDPNSLLSMVSKYADPQIVDDGDSKDNIDTINRIYTTFIGIGLDFDASLIQTISQTRGCNYYSVKSTKDFMKKMDDEFEYMVTPLVFNVCLSLKSEGNSCEIEKVYGRQLDKNVVSKIHTLFPSKRSGKRTKGGIQLIKLKKNAADGNDNINVEIEVRFEDRNDKKYINKQIVTFKAHSLSNDMIEEDDNDDLNDCVYDNIGIRKGILLIEYAELMMKWIKETSNNNDNDGKITDKYKKIFADFLKYFIKEMEECNDKDLQKEVDIIKKLIDSTTRLTAPHRNYNKSDHDELTLEQRLAKLQAI